MNLELSQEMEKHSVKWQIFDAVFLINLPERTDRRRDAEKELSALGLHVKDARLNWFAAVRPTTAGDFPSIGARGCFLSHLACIKTASERGYKRILIIEDDARFPQSEARRLQGAFEMLQNSSWNIWYGGHRVMNASGPGRQGLAVPIAADIGIQTSHCIAMQGDTIHSILAFFERILTRPNGHPDGGPMHVDGAYNTWRAQNPSAVAIIAEPAVCNQRSSRSDVSLLPWWDTVRVLRSAVDALRRLKN